MKGKLLTTQNVADYLGVPVATIYQWKYLGTGPRAIRVGRHLRFRPGDVESWLDANSDRAPA